MISLFTSSMRIFLNFLLLITAGFSQESKETIPVELRTKLGKTVKETTWPGEVTRIVAVTYDYEQEASEDVVVDGRLHKGVFLISGELNPNQRSKLYSAITGIHYHVKGAACFDPHHGFIFYDAADRILGSLTICFGCNRYLHSPKGELSTVFDLMELKNLMLELKMPIPQDPNAYKTLYKESKGRQAKAGQPTPLPKSELEGKDQLQPEKKK